MAGVVTSDADELEGRFPAGKANLCTSSLYYDALLSAAYLAEDLGKGSAVIKKYRQQASDLEKAIDSYFAATVEGFDTYAYYEGNDILRAWICIPLTVGINKRATGTIDALFSPRLWSENGLLTQAGSQTFWDRSTLYALRGAFMAGEIEKAMKFMKHYSGMAGRRTTPSFCRKRTLWTYYHRRHFRYSSHRTPFFHPDSSPTTRMGIYVPSENQSL